VLSGGKGCPPDQLASACPSRVEQHRATRAVASIAEARITPVLALTPCADVVEAAQTACVRAAGVRHRQQSSPQWFTTQAPAKKLHAVCRRTLYASVPLRSYV